MVAAGAVHHPLCQISDPGSHNKKREIENYIICEQGQKRFEPIDKEYVLRNMGRGSWIRINLPGDPVPGGQKSTDPRSVSATLPQSSCRQLNSLETSFISMINIMFYVVGDCAAEPRTAKCAGGKTATWHQSSRHRGTLSSSLYSVLEDFCQLRTHSGSGFNCGSRFGYRKAKNRPTYPEKY